jgi:NitT/TauT family transport system substrate-binding protein
MAKAFMRAYRKTRAYVIETPAAEIARAEQALFPEVDLDVLTETIATYQTLGCWSPHVEITHAAYEVTLDVFQHAGRITQRHPYEGAIAQPPEG